MCWVPGLYKEKATWAFITLYFLPADLRMWLPASHSCLAFPTIMDSTLWDCKPKITLLSLNCSGQVFCHSKETASDTCRFRTVLSSSVFTSLTALWKQPRSLQYYPMWGANSVFFVILFWKWGLVRFTGWSQTLEFKQFPHFNLPISWDYRSVPLSPASNEFFMCLKGLALGNNPQCCNVHGDNTSLHLFQKYNTAENGRNAFCAFQEGLECFLLCFNRGPETKVQAFLQVIEQMSNFTRYQSALYSKSIPVLDSAYWASQTIRAGCHKEQKWGNSSLYWNSHILPV